MSKRLYSLIPFLALAITPAWSKDTSFPGMRVSWTTQDGVRLVGLYRAPGRRGHWIWVLMHGLGSNKQEWLGLTERLAAEGDGFLIYDACGHGESVHQTGVADLDYRQFQTAGPGSQWDRMAGDMESAVQFLRAKYALNVRRIAVGGASLGANVALVYASEHPEVPAVMLLSPGIQYAGVGTEDPFRRYGDRPMFIAASPGDVYAYGTVQQLSGRRKDTRCAVVRGEGSAHGVNMLNSAFTNKLLAWIRAVEKQ